MLKCNSESRNHICYDAGSLKRDWHQKLIRLSQAVLFVGAILQEFSVLLVRWQEWSLIAGPTEFAKLLPKVESWVLSDIARVVRKFTLIVSEDFWSIFIDISPFQTSHSTNAGV